MGTYLSPRRRWIQGGIGAILGFLGPSLFATTEAATSSTIAPLYREGWRANPNQSLALPVLSATREKRDLLPGEMLQAGDQLTVPPQMVIWLTLGPGLHLLVVSGAEFSWAGPGNPVSLIKGEAQLLSQGITAERPVETPGFGLQNVSVSATSLATPYEVWFEVGPKTSILSSLKGRVQVELLHPASKNGLRGGWERYREVPAAYLIEGVHEPQKWNRLDRFSPALLRLNLKERFPGLSVLMSHLLGELMSSEPRKSPAKDPSRSALAPEGEVSSEKKSVPAVSPGVKKQRERLKRHQTEGAGRTF